MVSRLTNCKAAYQRMWLCAKFNLNLQYCFFVPFLVPGPRGHHKATFLPAQVVSSTVLCVWQELPWQGLVGEQLRRSVCMRFWPNFCTKLSQNIYIWCNFYQNHGKSNLTVLLTVDIVLPLFSEYRLPCFYKILQIVHTYVLAIPLCVR